MADHLANGDRVQCQCGNGVAQVANRCDHAHSDYSVYVIHEDDSVHCAYEKDLYLLVNP